MMMKRLQQVTGALVGLSLVAGAWSSDDGPPSVWLADDLIGLKVVSQEGDSLGDIHDVVVQPGGEVSYAVLSFGGWLGMGDKLFAMPWSVLKTVQPETAGEDVERKLVLGVDKEHLKAAPGFDEDNWPGMTTPDWSKEIDDFYSRYIRTDVRKPVDAAMRKSVMTWRVSELKGTDVHTPTGDNLGDIEEVAIDVNGRVSYVVLSVGGFLGIGDRHVAVPWDSLTFALGGDDGDEKTITLSSTKEKLEKAPEFKGDKEHREEMCGPDWINRTYQYFATPTYWNSKAKRDVEVDSKG